MTSTPATPETLRELIAGRLLTARERTQLLTDAVDDADLIQQHSPLMSPLVWDLAHIANQEELWLLRAVGGREPMHPEIDPLYDAFEHPAGGAAHAAAAAASRGPGLRARGARPGAGPARRGQLHRAPAGRPAGSRSAWSPSTSSSTTRPC